MTFTDDYGTTLFNIHTPLSCGTRPCVIHNPSEHHMREFKLKWRNDMAAFERICPHGIGHPDPDDPSYELERGLGIHSCDGCCRDPRGVPNFGLDSAA